jgi:hypothetical protein
MILLTLQMPNSTCCRDCCRSSERVRVSLASSGLCRSPNFITRSSSAQSYLKVVHDRLLPRRDELTLEEYTEFMPYRDFLNDVWSGFYASRARLKQVIREAERWHVALESTVASQHGMWLGVLSRSTRRVTIRVLRVCEDVLAISRQRLAIVQHHDAVTGTCANEAALDFHRYCVNVCLCGCIQASVT